MDPFDASKPGQNYQEFMDEMIREVTTNLAIPEDFMRLHDPRLTPEDRILLELKIELHTSWGLYHRKR